MVNAALPADLDPGLKLAAAAIAATGAAKDAIPSLLPVGLGQKGGEFDKVFIDTFQLDRAARPEGAGRCSTARPRS